MKKGVTLISIVIYLVLFFTFTVFATSVSSNMNKNVFMDKGSVEVEKDYSKLYINLFSSAKESNFYTIECDNTNNRVFFINFSNGDIYTFDNKLIYKNDGILVEDVENFSKIELNDFNNTSLSDVTLKNSKCLSFEVFFKKYDQTLKREIIITMGDE